MALKKLKKVVTDERTQKIQKQALVLRRQTQTNLNGRGLALGNSQAPGQRKKDLGLKNASTLAPGKAAAALPESGPRAKAVISAGTGGVSMMARGNAGAVAGIAREQGRAPIKVAERKQAPSPSSASQAPATPRPLAPIKSPVLAPKPVEPMPQPAPPKVQPPAPVAKAPTQSVSAVKPATPSTTSTKPTTSPLTPSAIQKMERIDALDPFRQIAPTPTKPRYPGRRA